MEDGQGRFHMRTVGHIQVINVDIAVMNIPQQMMQTAGRVGDLQGDHIVQMTQVAGFLQNTGSFLRIGSQNPRCRW